MNRNDSNRQQHLMGPLGIATGCASSTIQTVANMATGDMRTSEQIPRPSTEDRLLLTEWGVEFGNAIDKILFQCKIPAGWKKVPTDHYMYSNLVDNNGHVRASIMFKGVFYDYDGWTSSCKRLQATYHKFTSDRTDPMYPAVKDSSGNILWLGSAIPDTDGTQAYRVCGKRAAEILDKCCPKWQDARAYWDTRNDQLGLPPSEFVPPDLHEYKLYADLHDRNDGRYVDGGHSDTSSYPDDETAIRKFEAGLRANGARNYDVKFRITSGDRVVHRGEIKLPRQERRYRNGNRFDGFHTGDGTCFYRRD